MTLTVDPLSIECTQTVYFLWCKGDHGLAVMCFACWAQAKEAWCHSMPHACSLEQASYILPVSIASACRPQQRCRGLDKSPLPTAMGLSRTLLGPPTPFNTMVE